MQGEVNVNDQGFTASGRITKADETLGLVFGWAVICKERASADEPFAKHFDTQGHNVDEDGLVAAACDFMLNSRHVDDMHDGAPHGAAVFAFPLTEEIAKAYGIVTNRTGLLFAARPEPEMFEKFQSGEYTGFSIGGVHLEPPTPVTDAELEGMLR